MKNPQCTGTSGRRPMRLSSDPAQDEFAIGPGDRAAVEMARLDPLASIVTIFSYLPSDCAMRRRHQPGSKTDWTAAELRGGDGSAR